MLYSFSLTHQISSKIIQRPRCGSSVSVASFKYTLSLYNSVINGRINIEFNHHHQQGYIYSKCQLCFCFFIVFFLLFNLIHLVLSFLIFCFRKKNKNKKTYIKATALHETIHIHRKPEKEQEETKKCFLKQQRVSEGKHDFCFFYVCLFELSFHSEEKGVTSLKKQTSNREKKEVRVCKVCSQLPCLQKPPELASLKSLFLSKAFLLRLLFFLQLLSGNSTFFFFFLYWKSELKSEKSGITLQPMSSRMNTNNSSSSFVT